MASAISCTAKALSGVDIPILIKNPVNPDLDLWIGAIERINRAGVKKIAAIHRGFSTYTKVKYRNEPAWEVPIDLKRRIPEIQIIADPSHNSGNRELILEVSQQAMDLNFDGLMIESHIDPNNAWSDARQQLTPSSLNSVLNKLVIRNTNNNPKINYDLENLRSEIDKLDISILDILEKRMLVAHSIGKYKSENEVTIFQSGRYSEIMEKRVTQARNKGLSREFSEKIFKSIHEESILHQKMIMNKIESSILKK